MDAVVAMLSTAAPITTVGFSPEPPSEVLVLDPFNVFSPRHVNACRFKFGKNARGTQDRATHVTSGSRLRTLMHRFFCMIHAMGRNTWTHSSNLLLRREYMASPEYCNRLTDERARYTSLGPSIPFSLRRERTSTDRTYLLKPDTYHTSYIF